MTNVSIAYYILVINALGKYLKHCSIGREMQEKFDRKFLVAVCPKCPYCKKQNVRFRIIFN